jgi:hypothetical protein
MRFWIVARAGCDFYPLLIFKEEFIFQITSESEEELAERFKGKYLEIEGEKCILFSLKSLPLLEEFLTQKEDKESLMRLRKWWEAATLVRMNDLEGKLFIIKEV